MLIFIGAEPDSVLLHVKVGITERRYAIDDAAPWAVSSAWLYWDVESCVRAVNNALDVVDIVLPPFAEKMEDALG